VSDPSQDYLDMKEAARQEIRDRWREERRKDALVKEFDFLKDNFEVQFKEINGGKRTYTLRLSELFEMFELVRKRNEHQS
jgi:hypothetical protein